MSIQAPYASWRQLARLAHAPTLRIATITTTSIIKPQTPIHIPQAGPSRSRPRPTSSYTSLTSLTSHRPSHRHATTLTSQTPDSQPPPLPLPSRPKIIVTPPSIESIRADEFMEDDVELIPESKATIVITPEAVSQLALITSREPPEVLKEGKLALRLAVDNGGCHGFQDTMALTEERNVDDYVFQPEGVNCIPVVIDLVSLNLLKGATLHYATELIGSSFRIQDNPQAKAGGACGCGVSWEAA